MDYYAITYRNHPFIDGKTYKRMCFCCANVPQEIEQIYDKEGNIVGQEGPFFDWKHLRTAEDLFDIGSAESLEEAKRCVRAVKRAIREAGPKNLNKLKLVRPKPEFELPYDYDEPRSSVENKKRRKKSVTPKVSEPEKPDDLDVFFEDEPKKKPEVKEVKVKKFTATKRASA